MGGKIREELQERLASSESGVLELDPQESVGGEVP